MLGKPLKFSVIQDISLQNGVRLIALAGCDEG
jgi:hypothetical protein